jgi:hypothetical protein
LALSVADQEESHKVELQIIEWKSQTKRTLYLCTSSGFPVDQVDTRFHVGSFSFSAYVKSTFFDKMQKEGRIGLAELEPVVHSFIESARDAIKVYFQEREAEKARSIENRARLQFFQEHLQHNATESLAIEHLQERHRKLLEGVIVDGTDDEDDEGQEKKAG